MVKVAGVDAALIAGTGASASGAHTVAFLDGEGCRSVASGGGDQRGEAHLGGSSALVDADATAQDCHIVGFIDIDLLIGSMGDAPGAMDIRNVTLRGSRVQPPEKNQRTILLPRNRIESASMA